MRVLGRPGIEDAMRTHPDLRGALRAWTAEVERAEWRSSAEVSARYPRASLIGRRRVVFRLRGNRYRLIATVRYASAPAPGLAPEPGIVAVEWIGTHADYDRIDAGTVWHSMESRS